MLSMYTHSTRRVILVESTIKCIYNARCSPMYRQHEIYTMHRKPLLGKWIIQ